MLFRQNRFWSKAAVTLGAASMFGVPTALVAQEAQVKVTATVDDKGDEKAVAEVQVDAPKFWLGISLKPIEGDLASYLGSTDGVLVDTVYPDSPAEKSSLRPGDILTAVNGKALSTPQSLLEQMTAIKANEDGKVDALKIDFLRKGEKKSVELTPITRPENLTLTVNGKKIEVDGKNTFDFKFDFDADEFLSKLQDGSTDLKGMKIFRFGAPSEVVVQGKKEIKDGENNQVNKQRIEIRKEADGKLSEIHISRDGEAPAKITIKQDGDTKEYSEEDMDAIPESLRTKVKELLSTKPGDNRVETKVEMRRVKGIDLNADDDPSDSVIIIGPDGLRWNADLSKRHKEMVEKIAERAKTAAKVARDKAIEMPKELTELRSQIDALKAEIKELKDQIGKK